MCSLNFLASSADQMVYTYDDYTRKCALTSEWNMLLLAFCPRIKGI